MSQGEGVDYLVIGHITNDITPNGIVTGGTVAYGGRVAQVLGCRPAVLSSAAPDFAWQDALPGMRVHSVPAADTSTFENIYTPDGRIQIIHAVAGRLQADDVPDAWKRAPIVHLAPLTNEVDTEIVHQFSNSLIGITPQGWLRGWDENGYVYARAWEAARVVLPQVTAVVLSTEDLLDDRMLHRYREWANLLVLTQGADGCTVFLGDESRHIPAPAVTEVEATGAGDIFAAAFFVRLQQTKGNPWEAARFANQIAARSVTQRGLDAKINHIARYHREQITS